MNLDKLTQIVSLIVVLAIVTTIVSRRNSARVIREMGRAFSSSIRAAQGRR